MRAFIPHMLYLALLGFIAGLLLGLKIEAGNIKNEITGLKDNVATLTEEIKTTKKALPSFLFGK